MTRRTSNGRGSRVNKVRTDIATGHGAIVMKATKLNLNAQVRSVQLTNLQPEAMCESLSGSVGLGGGRRVGDLGPASAARSRVAVTVPGTGDWPGLGASALVGARTAQGRRPWAHWQPPLACGLAGTVLLAA